MCVVVKRRGAVKTMDPPTHTLRHAFTNLYSEDYGWIQRIMGYVHYRTVQCELYSPLNMFKDSKHLTQIIHDIAIGMIPFSLH